jgi:hypothetical protein
MIGSPVWTVDFPSKTSPALVSQQGAGFAWQLCHSNEVLRAYGAGIASRLEMLRPRIS